MFVEGRVFKSYSNTLIWCARLKSFTTKIRAHEKLNFEFQQADWGHGVLNWRMKHKNDVIAQELSNRKVESRYTQMLSNVEPCWTQLRLFVHVKMFSTRESKRRGHWPLGKCSPRIEILYWLPELLKVLGVYFQRLYCQNSIGRSDTDLSFPKWL